MSEVSMAKTMGEMQYQSKKEKAKKKRKGKRVKTAYGEAVADTTWLATHDKTDAAMAFGRLLGTKINAENIVFKVNSPAKAVMAQQDPSDPDGEKLYRTIALIGNEDLALESIFLGSTKGLIMGFIADKGQIQGFENENSVEIELPLREACKMLDITEDETLKEFIMREFFAGDDTLTTIEQREAAEVERIENERKAELAKEYEENYGTEWGGW